MRFMVTSLDAIVEKDRNRYRTSEFFPQIVNAPEDTPEEDIVALCFKDEFKPAHGKQYLIIALVDDNVRLVTFKHPRPKYEVMVQKFWTD